MILNFQNLFILLLFVKNFLGYKKLTYEEMNQKLHELQFFNTDIMKIEYSQYKFNLSALDCGDYLCLTPIISISGKKFNELLPSVYISGEVHGNEILGTQVCFYLIEYLLKSYKESNTWVQYLLSTRNIIITPYTNVQGFKFLRRGEQVNKELIDPNRDFPYNIKQDSKCFQTVTAKTIFNILKDNLIVHGITFHGGEESITYPWGSENHFNTVSETSPDFFAFDEIAQYLKNISSKIPSKFINFYNIGNMGDVVYPVQGGLEDFSYGYGWEKKINPNVTVTSCSNLNESEKEFYLKNKNIDNIRTPLYLVESSNDKDPAEYLLGNEEGIENVGSDNDGYVPRNIRLSLAVIDLVLPYIFDIKIFRISSQLLHIEWTVRGCINVNSTRIVFRKNNKTSSYGKTFSGKCKFMSWGDTFRQLTQSEEENEIAEFYIEANVDLNWNKNHNNSSPRVGPQSILVKLRDSNFSINYSSSNQLKGSTIIKSNISKLDFSFPYPLLYADDTNNKIKSIILGCLIFVLVCSIALYLGFQIRNKYLRIHSTSSVDYSSSNANSQRQEEYNMTDKGNISSDKKESK